MITAHLAHLADEPWFNGSNNLAIIVTLAMIVDIDDTLTQGPSPSTVQLLRDNLVNTKLPICSLLTEVTSDAHIDAVTTALQAQRRCLVQWVHQITAAAGQKMAAARCAEPHRPI